MHIVLEHGGHGMWLFDDPLWHACCTEDAALVSRYVCTMHSRDIPDAILVRCEAEHGAGLQAVKDEQTVNRCLPDLIDMILGWAMDDSFPAPAK